MTNFVSVATSAARYQDISLNPQKLAGQCSKLKCCLNFEADMYVESVKRMPPREIRLETADATYFHFKTDIFKREITYSTDKSIPANLVTITAARAFEVIAMNKQGEKPVQLLPDGEKQEKQKGEYADLLGQDSLTRFDKKKRKKKKSGGGGKQKDDGEQQQPRQRQQQQGKPDGADAKASAPQQQQNQQRRRNKNRNRQRPQQSDNKDNKEG